MGECTSIRKIIKIKINFLYSPNMVKFKVDNKNFIQSKLNLNEFKFGRRRFEELSASTKKKTIHMLINIQFLYVFLQVLREYVYFSRKCVFAHNIWISRWANNIDITFGLRITVWLSSENSVNNSDSDDHFYWKML